jgi:hypothetical protein
MLNKIILTDYNRYYIEEVSPEIKIHHITSANRLTEKVIVTATHDQLMDFLAEGDKVINFDYDADTDAPPFGVGPLYEANWVIWAKRKGCELYWVSPDWYQQRVQEMLEKGENTDDFYMLRAEEYEQSIIDPGELALFDQEVVLTFCLDYFANKESTYSEVEDARILHKPEYRDIENQIKKIAQVIKAKKLKIKFVHLAISADYAIESYQDIVLDTLIKELALNEPKERPAEVQSEKPEGLIAKLQRFWNSRLS